VDRQSLKFTFPEDSDRMETSETITLTNNGNATARFVWEGGASSPDGISKIFSVEPKDGTVRSKDSI
jgi:hypothetical protein